MIRSVITPEAFLEWGRDPPITAREYFNCGWSLRNIITRVKSLVTSGALWDNQPLRTNVRVRMDQCIQYVQKFPSEGIIAQCRRVCLGRREERSYLEEAQELWVTLSHYRISPLRISVILGPEETLESAMQIVTSRILEAEDGMQHFGNPLYRLELRDRIYALSKQEWEYQYESIAGALKRTVESVGLWWGARNSLESAFELIKRIDKERGVLVESFKTSEQEELVFQNSAWLTDKLLMDFAVTMLNVKQIELSGCFQVTEAGISAAKTARMQAHEEAHPLEITTPISDDWVVIS